VSWKALGACRGQDQSLFFPDPTQGQRAAVAAKKICSGCFVKGQCLDFALAHHEVGIWGGTTDKERKRIQARYIYNKHLAARRAAL
jgi:WhiB family redox-sensing transcriptional regulator